MATPDQRADSVATIEEKRARAILDQAELRLKQVTIEVGTVTSYDPQDGLTMVVLDSADPEADEQSRQTACTSAIEDIAPGERVYVTFAPEHRSIVTGRAKTFLRQPFVDFAIEGASSDGSGGPTLGAGGIAVASYSKRGQTLTMDFSVKFGPGCTRGTIAWRLTLPRLVASDVGWQGQTTLTVHCGEGRFSHTDPVNGITQSYPLTFDSVPNSSKCNIRWGPQASGRFGAGNANSFPPSLSNALSDTGVLDDGSTMSGHLSYPVD